MDIADKIHTLRIEKLKMSQDIFAMKLNVSRKTITNWESGATKPTTNHIMMLAIVCEVTTDYLIFEDYPLELSAHQLGNYEYNLLSEIINYYIAKNAKAEDATEK